MSMSLNPARSGPRWTLIVIIVGIIALVGAAFAYFYAGDQLSQNLSQRRLELEAQQGQSAPVQSESEGMMLMASEVERRNLLRTQNYAIVAAGAGIILVAGGYLVGDIFRKRRPNPQPGDSLESRPG